MQIPFSEHAEASLLARLLLDPKQVPLVAGLLDEKDFYIARFRKVYRAMLSLSLGETPIDVVTLREEMGEKVPDEVQYLEASARAPLEEYATVIRDRSMRRRVMAAVDRVMEAAGDPNKDPMSELGDVFGELIAKATGEEGLESAAEAGAKYLLTLSARATGESTGWTWGIPGLDSILLPAEPGEQIVIAARPSVGKTVMAENIVDHWSTLNRGPILFVSLEMKRSQLWDRGVARTAGIAATRIRRGELTPEELEQAKLAVEQRRLMDIEYLDKAGATTAQIRAAAQKTRIRNDGRLGGIVVDYMQIVGDRGENENQRLSRISEMLKRLAMEQNVPILALSQFNRMAESKGGPKLHHLRDSGAIEQNADTVVSIDGEVGGKARYVEVLKQRQGGVGFVNLILDGDTCTFRAPQAMVPVAQRAVTAPVIPSREELFATARAQQDDPSW